MKKTSAVFVLLTVLFLALGSSIPALAQFGYAGEEPSRALFDITLSIQKEYKKVKAGGNLKADIKLLNFGTGVTETTQTNVSLDYSIEDNKKNVILSDSEEITVIGLEDSFVKTFKVPSNAKSGRYVLYSKMTYNEADVATASDSFEILGEGLPRWVIISIIVGACVLIVVLILLIIRALARREKS